MQTDPAKQMLRYFKYAHLKDEKLQATSKLFCDAAFLFADAVPAGPEKTAGMRKLLEAKDCAVRAMLPPEE